MRRRDAILFVLVRPSSIAGTAMTVLAVERAQ